MMILFRYLIEMGHKNIAIDFADEITYVTGRDTPHEEEYIFKFPVLNEWKDSELTEFSSNNVRSTISGELRVAEM
jgi:hypothetical protein